MMFFYLFINVVLVFSLGFYLQSCMQWYSYRLNRVVFHFSKPLWHLIFFALPVLLYYFLFLTNVDCLAVLLLYPFSLFFWRKKLDKPLQFTPRVKRFFLFLTFALILSNLIIFKLCGKFSVLTPLILASFVSFVHEKILFSNFKKQAKNKLNSMSNIRIVAITASYGKTSIKNFLYHILSAHFKCYATPRSVNTISGIVMDINKNLPQNTEIYIAEAGARESGDIKDIADFLTPQIAIVGQIGVQHLEYFKSLENIRNTKMELINAENLQKAFIHKSANAVTNGENRITIWGDEITFIDATLEGTKFGVMISGREIVFETSLLGAFNAQNLLVCIKTALYLGVDLECVKTALKSLKSVEHRLQKIIAGGKIIIDDSFNGNFEGMKSSYELVKTYSGKKILITPGIVESTKDDNEELAKIADKIFNIIIITGKINVKFWSDNIKTAEKIILKDKSLLENVLTKQTKSGDLILFSNDAPTYM